MLFRFPDDVDESFKKAAGRALAACEDFLDGYEGCSRVWIYLNVPFERSMRQLVYFDTVEGFLSCYEWKREHEEIDRDVFDFEDEIFEGFSFDYLEHVKMGAPSLQRIIVSYDRVSGVVSAEFDTRLRIDPDNILRSSELLIDEWIVSHGGRALLDRPAVSLPLEADCEEEEEFEVRETQVVFPEYVDQMCEDGLEYWGDLPGLERLWIYTMFTEIGGISTQVFFETGDAFLNSIQLQDFGDGRDSYDFNSDLMEYQVVDELLESVDGVEPRPTRVITVRDLATGATEAEWTTEPVIDPAIPDDNYIDVRDRWIIAHGGVALNERNRI